MYNIKGEKQKKNPKEFQNRVEDNIFIIYKLTWQNITLVMFWSTDH